MCILCIANLKTEPVSLPSMYILKLLLVHFNLLLFLIHLQALDACTGSDEQAAALATELARAAVRIGAAASQRQPHAGLPRSWGGPIDTVTAEQREAESSAAAAVVVSTARLLVRTQLPAAEAALAAWLAAPPPGLLATSSR